MHPNIWLIFCGLLLTEAVCVKGILVMTTVEVEAVRGKDVKLKCIFYSSSPVSPSTVSVVWFYKPLRQIQEIAVMYYQSKPYPPTSGRFRKRVLWSGDVMNNDASITLKRVSKKFTGTYTCKVKNIPDVHGTDGEVQLRVVNVKSLF